MSRYAHADCWAYEHAQEICWGKMSVIEDGPGEYSVFCEGHGTIVEYWGTPIQRPVGYVRARTPRPSTARQSRVLRQLQRRSVRPQRRLTRPTR